MFLVQFIPRHSIIFVVIVNSITEFVSQGQGVDAQILTLLPIDLSGQQPEPSGCPAFFAKCPWSPHLERMSSLLPKGVLAGDRGLQPRATIRMAGFLSLRNQKFTLLPSLLSLKKGFHGFRTFWNEWMSWMNEWEHRLILPAWEVYLMAKGVLWDLTTRDGTQAPGSGSTAS